MRERAPLIVTLRFDAESFRHFDDMRRRHFPPERNHIPAHLTLFHALPGTEERHVREGLAEVCAASPALPLRVSGLRFLGYGTSYAIEAPALVALRRRLAERFGAFLGRQDAAGFHPHVTIQNKAPAREAKALHAALSATFSPFEATGTGLFLQRYLGGPWEEAGEFPFEAAP